MVATQGNPDASVNRGLNCTVWEGYAASKLYKAGFRSNNIDPNALGTIDTREKFLEHRLELVKNVWRAMEKTDSREYRNCHNYEYMDFVEQGRCAVGSIRKVLRKAKPV